MMFPIMQPRLYPQDEPQQPYRDVAWDWQNNRPLWQDGVPVFAQGVDAVAAWAYNALITQRCRYPIYTYNHGSELEALVGGGYSLAEVQTEAKRMVRESLLVCPYITDIQGLEVAAHEGNVSIACKLITVYGEVAIRV